MQEFAAKTPPIPIPFHRLLKVVALVDGANAQVAALLDRLRAEKIEVEVSDRYARDVLDAIRSSRFRPKFVDGEAVATTGVAYREVFWTAAPRT